MKNLLLLQPSILEPKPREVNQETTLTLLPPQTVVSRDLMQGAPCVFGLDFEIVHRSSITIATDNPTTLLTMFADAYRAPSKRATRILVSTDRGSASQEHALASWATPMHRALLASVLVQLDLARRTLAPSPATIAIAMGSRTKAAPALTERPNSAGQ